MEKAAFTMRGYKFIKVELNFDKPLLDDLKLELIPRGIFNSKNLQYELFFDFIAKAGRSKVVQIRCRALFDLSSPEIPDYFYANSIAIVFPYVRAFISTVSLQANIGKPIVLPTYNLTSLKEQLRSNTENK